MDIERARDIVKAVNARGFATMGLDHELPALDGVSLAEMIEAKTIVRNVNKANAATANITGGSRTIYVVPDDRLIAAVYCMHHYPCSREPVLCVPHGQQHQKVVAVLTIPNAEPADEEE